VRLFGETGLYIDSGPRKRVVLGIELI
jgi:hypothetical protein